MTVGPPGGRRGRLARPLQLFFRLSVLPLPVTKPPPRGLPMQRRRILVADDNEANRHTLRHLVQTEYLDVETASNGEEALEALIGNNFSVLITDLRMPGLNGMQIIEEMQKRRLPTTVIVMTGHGSVDEAVQA